MIRFYGCKKDQKDERDHRYSAPKTERLPRRVDLRPLFPQIVNQDILSSCTGNAWATAFAVTLAIQKSPVFYPSRLFIYYNERVLEDTVEDDEGAMIRSGAKALSKFGACVEVEWPYDVAKFSIKPVDACYKHADLHQAIKYMRVNKSLRQLKGCLAAGYPFVFGFKVYESFESDEVTTKGKMSMPKFLEKSFGRHAVVAAGYDDNKEHFIIANSWGKEWGDKGYFYMPYKFMTKPLYTNDFWTLRLVESDTA